MTDRLFSLKTIVQVVAVLALGAASGLAYNSMRPEGQVDLDRQYFGAKVNAQRAREGAGTPQDSSKGTPSNTAPEITEPQDTDQQSADPKSTDPKSTDPANAGATIPPADETASATETAPAAVDTPANEVPVEPPPPPADGLQRMALIDAQDMVEQEGIAVFVDARKRADYDAGHIPGAVYLSHYESSNLIDDLRPTLEQAFFIIVYCNGGQCEDSKSLAFDLISVYGFAHENVYVFEGGMEEWIQAGLAVEKSE